MKVFKLNDSEYVIECNNRATQCKSIRLLVSCMLSMNVEYDEIQYGLSQLINKDHNVAEYGVGLSGSRMFLYTHKVAS
jgi:hypothetical protein